MKILGQTSDDKIYPITIDADGHLQLDILSVSAGNNLIGRVDARDGDKIWSFHAQLFHHTLEPNAVAGSNIITGTTVPAGEIWNVTMIGFYDVNNTMSNVGVQVNMGGDWVYVYFNTNPSAGIPEVIYINLYLEEGDIIRGRYAGCTLNDDLEFFYHGSIMQI